jgi:hypothetical protein
VSAGTPVPRALSELAERLDFLALRNNTEKQVFLSEYRFVAFKPKSE